MLLVSGTPAPAYWQSCFCVHFFNDVYRKKFPMHLVIHHCFVSSCNIALFSFFLVIYHFFFSFRIILTYFFFVTVVSVFGLFQYVYALLLSSRKFLHFLFLVYSSLPIPLLFNSPRFSSASLYVSVLKYTAWRFIIHFLRCKAFSKLIPESKQI